MGNLRRYMLAVAALATLWALPQGAALVFNVAEQKWVALRSWWAGSSAEVDGASLSQLAHSDYLRYVPGRCYAELRGQHQHSDDRVRSVCISQIQ
jgi:hypothetical protein